MKNISSRRASIVIVGMVAVILMLTAAMLTLAETPPVGTVQGVTLPPAQAEATDIPGVILLCHATGDATTPYELLTIDEASTADVQDHDGHVNDIIPVPAEGCPNVLWPGRTDGPNKVTLCHATGSATNPYVEITVSHNAATEGRGHANHVQDIIPAPADGCPSVISEATSEVTSEPTLEGTSEPTPEVTSEPAVNTITVCHATGSETNPYETITVSTNAATEGHGHDDHVNDIIPAPLEGCPNVLWLSPADGPKKIDICHATGSATNPYVEINVSYNAATQGHGHANHVDDIIPAPAEGCPAVLWAGGLNPAQPTIMAPPALTPIPVAGSVCVDWFVYSTNVTGDWEIYRLGVLPENPNADANLTKGAGQNISDIAPSLSPDRRWLTFSSNRTGNWEVYVGSTDGAVQQRVTQTSAQNANPVWSPAGQFIAFESNRDGTWGLYMVDVTTGVETRLTFDTANYINPSWSPDGTRLLFQSDRGGRWQIYELDVATMNYQLRSDGQGDDFDPSYSADGNRIVFRSLRDVNSVIYVMNQDGTGVTRISNPAARALNPVWSPDNSLIAYQANPGGDMEIFVYEVATGRTRQVTDNLVDDYAPTWLCSSPTLVFTSDIDGNPNIFSTSALPMEAAPVAVQDQAARMTTDIAMDRYPVGSPGESHASLVGDR